MWSHTVITVDSKLLSLDQVADYLGVHRDTVYKLVRSGRLPALQLGGRKAGWRVAEEDLQEFVTNGKTATSGGLIQSDEARLQAFDAAQRRELDDFHRSQAEKRVDFVRGQGEHR
jgi:excisionase family DNA binding protein